MSFTEPTPLRVLFIDDSADDVALIARQLRASHYDLQSRRVDSADALREALQESWDIILGDYSMPGFSGVQALAIVHGCGIDTPFIFVSGTIGEEVAVEAMRIGAQDYIMKDNLKRLLPAVERELRESVMRRERRLAQERVTYLAHHDVVTGLPNRILLMDRLEQARRDAERSGKLLAIMFLDLDGFKAVNDSLGHKMGDKLLQTVAKRLEEGVRKVDTVARVGGDEFVVVLANLSNSLDAGILAEKLLHVLAQPLQMDKQEVFISASIGVALFPGDGDSVEELVRKADVAMYRSKQIGRNTYQFYSAEMITQANERMKLAMALRGALEHGEFTLYYHPVVDFAAGRIVSVEALLRWQRSPTQLVTPASFIRLAEELGMTVPIGEWVIRRALSDVRAWRQAGLPPIRVAVNFSPRQLQRPSSVQDVFNALTENKLDPSVLEIEITEDSLLSDVKDTLTTLQALRSQGVTINLDDFGTGYSSLSYLKRFPVDGLKIDQSFVRGGTGDQDDMAIVTAIVTMAHALRIRVIAEGVETPKQLEFIRTCGCDGVQGFLLSLPIPRESIPPLLINGISGVTR